MQARIKLLRKRVENNLGARSRTERAILLALSFVFIWSLGFLFVIEPLRVSIAAHNADDLAVAAKLRVSESNYQEMLSLMDKDPNELSRARLLVVLEQQERLDQEISGLARDLIQPAAMTQLLISMLENQQGLNLVGFENLEVEAVSLDGNEDPVDNRFPSEGEVRPLASIIYQHGIRIDFEGDYFSTLQYLLFLEEMSESFFWDSLSYEELDWPLAHVQLEIHTLSTEEGFIGG